jgi:uncharacterized UPF0160 family protein
MKALNNTNKIVRIGTHNGLFHSDEVFAVAMMSITAELQGLTVQVTRTRDLNILNTQHYIIDVGGQYDGVKCFDHHQSEYKGDLSSAGMIAKYLWIKDSNKIKFTLCII